MSYDLHVFLKDARVPSAEEWQRAIHRAGFDVTWQADFIVREHRGVLPALYKNHATGFELDWSLTSAILTDYPMVAGHIEGFDRVATCRWGSDLSDGIAAIIASAVLTNLCDGILFDPQESTFVGKDDGLRAARRSVQELEAQQGGMR